MKNQIVSGIRGFSRGLVFVALAASLVLGACEVIGQPEVEDLASYTVPDAEGRVRVSVLVPEDVARSFTVAQAQNVSNYFEVIFRDRDAMRPKEPYYYTDSKPKGESLNVQLPLGHHFDILLLAGYKAKRVLLGSSYVNTKLASGRADYSSTGEGYLIEAGKANIINMAITAITVNPADDFAVSYNGEAVTIERNDDDTAIDNAEAALTDAQTALTTAKTKLGAITAAFTTGSTSINAQFTDIASKTTADLGSLPGTGTMLAEFAAFKATYDAALTAAATQVNLEDVEDAIDDLDQTPEKIEDAIVALKAAIVFFKTADGEIIDLIEAANDALLSAWELSDTATAADTDQKEDIEAAVEAVETALATINDPDEGAGSLLEAVAYAVTAVNKTREGSVPATGNLIMAIPKQEDTTSGDFEVEVTNTRLTPLIHAQGTSDADKLFYAHTLTLGYAGKGERSFIDTSTSAPVLDLTGDTLTTTYTIPRTEMPDEDAYGILYFDTIYYPFSASDAGYAWYIRDGVDNTKVDFDIDGTTIASTPTGSDRTGGAVFVTIGKGGDPFETDIPVVTH